MPSVDDVRAITASLPRSYEVSVRGCIKFRVGSIVYAAFSKDESIIGFAFPKELRTALVDSDPDKFLLPARKSDLRFNWIEANISALARNELYALVIAAWKMVVPQKVAADFSARPATAARRGRGSRRAVRRGK